MLQQQINRRTKSQNYTLSAPIGGLNVRDSLDTMPETDAIVMDNYLPQDTKIIQMPVRICQDVIRQNLVL